MAETVIVDHAMSAEELDILSFSSRSLVYVTSFFAIVAINSRKIARIIFKTSGYIETEFGVIKRVIRPDYKYCPIARLVCENAKSELTDYNCRHYSTCLGDLVKDGFSRDEDSWWGFSCHACKNYKKIPIFKDYEQMKESNWVEMTLNLQSES